MPLVDTIEIFQMTNVGDHIDGTDVYQSNPNLLDNAYFVGGGSQLGDGVFPINQRGQTSYTGNTYTIDRWVIASSAITVTLNAGYIELSGTAGNNFSQVIAPKTAKALYGKTVTASALMYDGTILTGTGIFPTRPASSWNFVGFVYGTDVALIIGTSELYRSEFFIQTQSASAKVCAVKLELGTVSTLANDPPPDFGEELRKCQRYLFIMGGAPYTMFGSGIAETSSYMMATIPFPVPMRATPTLTVSSSFRIWGGVGYEFGVGGISISSATQIATNCTYGGVMCSVSAGNLTVGNIYYLQANNDINSKLIFSAEL